MIGGFQVTHTIMDEANKLRDPIANARAYLRHVMGDRSPHVEDQPPARVSIFVDGREVGNTKS